MKKIIIMTLFAGILFPVAGFSQLDKGDLMNSFSAGLSFYHKNFTDDGYKINDIDFSLTDGLGIFVIDRLAVGPGLTFSLENNRETHSDQAGDYTFNRFTYNILFSPFVRYYFAKNGKLAFFAQGSGTIGYSHDKYKDENPNEPTTEYNLANLSYGGAAGVGLNFFFTDNIALESQLSYSFIAGKTTFKSDQSTSISDQHVNTGSVLLSVGLNFFLQPGK